MAAIDVGFRAPLLLLAGWDNDRVMARTCERKVEANKCFARVAANGARATWISVAPRVLGGRGVGNESVDQHLAPKD